MRENRTKARLRSGELVYGCALQQYRSPEIPRLLAAVGFDYLFIDTEHGAFNLETVQDLVSASNHAGITPFVRVGEMLYSLVTRALDIGAQGIIFPRVESPRAPDRGRRMGPLPAVWKARLWFYGAATRL